eukprot:3034967-Rhodomonas_salina.1
MRVRYKALLSSYAICYAVCGTKERYRPTLSPMPYLQCGAVLPLRCYVSWGTELGYAATSGLWSV